MDLALLFAVKMIALFQEFQHQNCHGTGSSATEITHTRLMQPICAPTMRLGFPLYCTFVLIHLANSAN